ncbi:MAG: hypothetical protein K2M98_06925, partial [Muribaculum sp.]|nr:hypothetical protein [Muribaculum sp.]
MKKSYFLAVVALLLSGVMSTVQAADAPITTLPEGGTTTLYSRSGGCYYAYAGNNYATMEYDYLPVEVVEYDNGDVYVKNIISQYDYSYYKCDSYIKGHKEGSTISFPMPQMVITQTWGMTTYHYYVSMLEYSNAKKTFVPVADDKQVYTMTVKDDGTIAAETINNGMEFIGMVDDDNDWCYYGEVFMNLTKMTEVPVTLPAGVNPVQMRAVSGETSRDVVMAFDGNDVYLQGIFELKPDAWIKGQRNGNKVSFASGQYLGISQTGSFFGYFMAAEFEQDYSSTEEGRVIKPREAIVYDYDEAAGIMVASSDYLMVYNKNPKNIDYMEYVVSPKFQAISDNISKQPKDPWNVGFRCYNPKTGQNGQILFLSSELNVDGYALDEKNLYYRLFINGEPFVFTKKDFYSIEKDMTFVPYNYADAGGQIQTYEANHLIYGYECFENITSVGVQICYIEGEPKVENIVAQSKIVTYPETENSNYTPKNPENVVFNKAVNAWDYTTLSFEVEPVNTDGDNLKTNNLYYAIYFDHSDTPVEFKKNGTDYYYITEPMTYVPYNFVDYQTKGMDFMVDGNKRTVYIYDKNVNVAGVRLVYIAGNVTPENIIGQSEIVYPEEPKKNLTPKNPENVVFNKAVNAWDYTTFSFEVEAVNT